MAENEKDVPVVQPKWMKCSGRIWIPYISSPLFQHRGDLFQLKSHALQDIIVKFREERLLDRAPRTPRSRRQLYPFARQMHEKSRMENPKVLFQPATADK